MNFDNEKRERYYGLRKGDIVSCESRHLKQFKGTAKVVAKIAGKSSLIRDGGN